MTVDEAIAALDTPLGPAGSGKMRYAAAMTLWSVGLMRPDVLECYRICAHVDAADPAMIQADRGLLPSADTHHDRRSSALTK